MSHLPGRCGIPGCSHCGEPTFGHDDLPLMDTQDFLIFATRNKGNGLWDLHLGPDDGDPWVSVRTRDLGGETPMAGDIATVRVPKVLKIVKPNYN